MLHLPTMHLQVKVDRFIQDVGAIAIQTVGNAVATDPRTRQGQLLASGSYDCTIRLWDAETGRSRNLLTVVSAPFACESPGSGAGTR